MAGAASTTARRGSGPVYSSDDAGLLTAVAVTIPSLERPVAGSFSIEEKSKGPIPEDSARPPGKQKQRTVWLASASTTHTHARQ